MTSAPLPTPSKSLIPAFTPVPRKTARHDGWTPERQRGFIEGLADLGSVRAAANAVNMTPEGAYLLRRHPQAQEFRKAWEAALKLGVQRLEDIAMDRALNGVEVPVYSYGKLVGTRRVYNDRLLMFLLRNRAPKRFAEGKAKALNALDNAKVAKLRKQWRKEWEAQQREKAKASSEEMLAKIESKVARLQEVELAQMSEPVRKAWDAYQRALREEEKQEGKKEKSE